MDELLNTAPCGFLTLADDGTIQQVNATLLRWLGYERGAVQGKHINLLLPVAGRIFYQTHLFPLLKLRGQVGELALALRGADGEAFPVLVSAARGQHAGTLANNLALLPMRQRSRYEDELRQAKQAAEAATQASARANAVLKQLRADLEAKQAELLTANAQLAVLVATDPLTGVLNRRAFEERLTAATATAVHTHTPLSLLLVDADHFKQINDTLGHTTGDAVLRAVAHMLSQNTRATDTIARYGGEEFALILPDTNQACACSIAWRLCHTVAAETVVGTAVTVSVGAATLCPGVGDAHQLLIAADQALYMAKAQGRNRAIHAANTLCC